MVRALSRFMRIIKPARVPIILFIGTIFLIFSLGAVAQDRVGSTSQPLTTTSDATDWTTQNNEVPVCWETPGYDREKDIVRNAVSNTWEWHANIRFTGWYACPTEVGIGGSGTVRNVRIRIHAQDTSNAGAGGSARVGTAALSSAEDNNPGVNLSFNPDGTADEGRVEYIAVHEFGHVLGFIHEQDAPGNEGPAKCNQSVDSDANPIPITGYDRDSVMNYCNRDGNMTGYLTDVDIAGVQKVYGVRKQNVATLNPCASAPLKGMASLAAPWNNGGLASIAVYPSDGTSFPGWTQWVDRDGGWGDEVKWTSGDFNGDGKFDIGAIWNNNGSNVLTTRLSTGSTFTHEHWLLNGGGWINTTAWMAGDFNGDGKSDIAGAWNNNGLASIAVYPSDGTSFPGWTQWTDRDGGWGNTVRWMAGDFNGDGKTDVGAAWNNDGITTLTVRLSQGDKFSHVHWRENAGRWWDSAIFVAGDFNGDGLDDIAQLWNDMGLTSIKVSLSNGSQFQVPVDWSKRDGGWGGIIRWISGDFNGDGRTDIAAIWNNGGTNTITVRASDGAKFTHAHWATNAGGWIDSTAWCAGKFQ
ncbi:FG-GAP-like repeat-containing protein [Gloeocapsa sp. PCC 73106]|uniref:FG-GAP-like repeat-containing protein n=1 Tax=Gloeocapsa sp. PCC 73106 TaxID=102232 RepID=UPI0002ACB0F2|nr:FG-GAP-like repeat-containing protein [Gloeocapsa sp. PCC 73106]ELR96493.1 FG-GAP repeat protein [Gloeocapsa sp. PCC 73106]